MNTDIFPLVWSSSIFHSLHSTFLQSIFSPLLLSFIIVVQSLSYVQLSVTPQTAAHQAPLSSSRVCSNLCPLSLWCYRTISSSAAPFTFFLQSYPASGYFPMSQLFTLSEKITGASARELPMNIQSWFPLEFDFISLKSKKISRVFSSTTIQKRFFETQPFYGPTHIRRCLVKNHSFDYTDICWQSNVSAF